MYLQKIKADGTGLQNVIQEKVTFLYDISPDGKWLAVWTASGTDINLPFRRERPHAVMLALRLGRRRGARDHAADCELVW
jgi:hypothetical protein